MSIFSMQIILFFSVALGFGIFYFRYMITLDIDKTGIIFKFKLKNEYIIKSNVNPLHKIFIVITSYMGMRKYS